MKPASKESPAPVAVHEPDRAARRLGVSCPGDAALPAGPASARPRRRAPRASRAAARGSPPRASRTASSALGRGCPRAPPAGTPIARSGSQPVSSDVGRARRAGAGDEPSRARGEARLQERRRDVDVPRAAEQRLATARRCRAPRSRPARSASRGRRRAEPDADAGRLAPPRPPLASSTPRVPQQPRVSAPSSSSPTRATSPPPARAARRRGDDRGRAAEHELRALDQLLALAERRHDVAAAHHQVGVRVPDDEQVARAGAGARARGPRPARRTTVAIVSGCSDAAAFGSSSAAWTSRLRAIPPALPPR